MREERTTKLPETLLWHRKQIRQRMTSCYFKALSWLDSQISNQNVACWRLKVTETCCHHRHLKARISVNFYVQPRRTCTRNTDSCLGLVTWLSIFVLPFFVCVCYCFSAPCCSDSSLLMAGYNGEEFRFIVLLSVTISFMARDTCKTCLNYMAADKRKSFLNQLNELQNHYKKQ